MSPNSRASVKNAQPEIRTFGRFLIEAEVGRGAFGNVYRARDPQLDRIVAIKIPRFNSETASKQRSRFLIEAKAAAGLHHPNIVAVYDAGNIEQQLFIASAFIDGCSLRTLIKTSGRPSQAAVARMVMKIAEALAYAHSQGIVHRDIKPENILVNKDGEPFIADFGLARIQDDSSTETRDGAILGTVGYMSPEQAEGQANKVDGRTDLWSLGVILYELLAGKRPFEGGDIQILYAIRYEEPSDLRRINSEIDRDLETICKKCLTKALEYRYPDCDALKRDLEAWLNDQTISARRPSLLERLQRWYRHNPSVAILTTACAMILLTSSILILGLWIRSESSRKAALEAKLVAEQQTALVEEQRSQLVKQNVQLNETTKSLDEEKQNLRKTVSNLEKANKTIEAQLTEIREKESNLQKTRSVAEEATTKAEQEQNLRITEQSRNKKLRYFSQINEATLQIRSGQQQSARELLEQTDKDLRSLEYGWLLQKTRDANRYKVIDDIFSLPKEEAILFATAHFPLPAIDAVSNNPRLLNETVNEISKDGENFLIQRSEPDWLLQHLQKHEPGFFSQLSIPPFDSDRLQFELLQRSSARSTFSFVGSKTGFRQFNEQGMFSEISPNANFVAVGRLECQLEQLDDRSTKLNVQVKLIVKDIREREGKLLQEWGVGEVVFSRAGRDQPFFRRETRVTPQYFKILFSEDERHLIVCCSDSIAVWRIQSKVPELLWRLDHNGLVGTRDIRLAKNNRLLECTSSECKFLDLETGKVVNTVPYEQSLGSSNPVFSDSGKTIASVSPNSVSLIDTLSGKYIVRDLPIANRSYASSMNFERKRTELATAGVPIFKFSRTKLVESPNKAWFSIKIEEQAEEKIKTNTINYIDSRQLIVRRKPFEASERLREICLKSLSKSESPTLVCSSDMRWSAVWNENSLFLIDNTASATQNENGTGKRWDSKSGPISSVDFGVDDGSSTIKIAAGGEIVFLKLPTLENDKVFACSVGSEVRSLPGGSWVVVADRKGRCQLLSTKDGTLVKNFRTAVTGHTKISFDNEVNWIVTGGIGGIQRFNNLTGAKDGFLQIDAPLKSIEVMSDKKLFATILKGNKIVLYDWPELRRLSIIEVNDSELLTARCTQDSQRVLAVTTSEFILYDVLTGTEIVRDKLPNLEFIAAQIDNSIRNVVLLTAQGQIYSFQLPSFGE